MATNTSTAPAPHSGKIALITGAARGLGVETARELAALGIHVIIGARDGAKAESVAASIREQGGSASSLKLDVTSGDDRQAAYATIERDFSRLDILINNAGVLLDSPDGGTPATKQPSVAPEDILRTTFEINFFAPILLTQLLLPLLRRSEAPRIVNVSSIRGSQAHLSDPTSPVYPVRALGYDTSKTALNAFTILLAAELSDTPFKINAIHPGWVRSEMGGDHAPMSVEEGGRTAVKYATLGEDGPSGGFFFLDERLPW